MTITGHIGLVSVILFIGCATVYVLLDYGLAIRLTSIGLAVLTVAVALFFLLRRLDVKFNTFDRLKKITDTLNQVRESEEKYRMLFTNINF